MRRIIIFAQHRLMYRKTRLFRGVIRGLREEGGNLSGLVNQWKQRNGNNAFFSFFLHFSGFSHEQKMFSLVFLVWRNNLKEILFVFLSFTPPSYSYNRSSAYSMSRRDDKFSSVFKRKTGKGQARVVLHSFSDFPLKGQHSTVVNIF